MANKYEEVEKLVLEYKSGQANIAEQLVEHYKGFMNKYIDVICDGNVNLSNKSVRSFVSLFFSDKGAKRKVGHYYRSPYIMIQSSMSVSSIYKTYIHFDKEEIENVLAQILFEMATKYKPMDEIPRFHSYLMSAYHFKVYHSLNALTKDPLFHSVQHGLYFDEENILSYDEVNENILEVRYPILLTESDTVVDDNWIAGFTTGELFSYLSPVDRKILKLSYVDKFTDAEIADMFGTCRATINRRKSQSKRILTSKLSDLHLLKV